MAVDLYRVFSHRLGAANHEPGGALFIPPQGLGRIDNPQHYQVLYVSTEPEAAVAESFGARPSQTWTAKMLRGHPLIPGSVRALAHYELADWSEVCDLDDPRRLLEQKLRPSQVITRDYWLTQEWALRIYQQRARWVGLRWWSFYEGRWSSLGLWDRARLVLRNVVPLDLRHPALLGAAARIGRQVAE
ncbi:MAG: hypothetical protein DLM53_06000 [Candidatus Eremiobacter antarcticus]|nr:RES domain-containing protein [Candidatus Eremiobacteraeota bacterium]PZR62370.1 MAG: hypothetical protein DLM53_06000 [Candidatus Eremiobacter sp. RRmetagenome_bin22]